MRFLSIFLLLFFIPLIKSELKFTQIFFRHGQRLPTNYLTYPTEHLNLSSLSGLEQGELTKFGIQQTYNLGQNLRKHYLKLIGEIYKAANLIVYSGIDNRTVASALGVLAGLFPPIGSQIWNEKLPWLPIPVFAIEQLDDVSFGIFGHCPYYIEKDYNTSRDDAIFQKFHTIANFLVNKTGVPIGDLNTLQRVVDGIVSRSSLTDFLPLPKWADDPKFVKAMFDLEDQMHSQFIQLLLPDTGEWHFDLLVGAFDDFISNKSSHKMALYSGHDTNMMTMGIYLNISLINTTLQPTASYLAFDLIQNSKNEYFIEVFLHSQINGTRERLEIGLCGDPCLYSEFKTLGSRLSTADFNAICKNSNTKTELYGGIASILLIVVILLLALLALTICSCLSWKKRYEKLLDEEQRPLIPVTSSQ